jgi:signal peptidase I
MEFKAQHIADFLGGVIEGDPNITVSGVAKIEEGIPGTLAFLSNPKYNKYLYETQDPVKVPKGYVFVMGDNRNNSYDSRFSPVGMIDVRDIVGKVVFRIFPFNGFGWLN